MAFIIKDAHGTEVGGDPKLDEFTKAAAILAGGWVEDKNGVVVYRSRAYEEFLKQSEESGSDT